MKHRAMALLLAVPLAAVCVGRVAAQAITAPVNPQAQPAVPQKRQGPVVPPSKQPPGAYQLTMMKLTKTEFLPNSFWSYEEADPDLSPGTSVEQLGSATFGGPLEEKHGAFVRYCVQIEPDADKAHLSLARFKPRSAFNVEQTVRPVSGADEGTEYLCITINSQKVPQRCWQLTALRYGAYVVWIESQSDMRAPGPRPAKGERLWMSQPIHHTILAAVQQRWADYKTRLAGVDVKAAAAQRMQPAAVQQTKATN